MIIRGFDHAIKENKILNKVFILVATVKVIASGGLLLSEYQTEDCNQPLKVWLILMLCHDITIMSVSYLYLYYLNV